MDFAARGRLQYAGLPLDRHTGIVRDFLPAARKGVEQGGLAAVRRPDKREVRNAADFALRAHEGRFDEVTRIAIASRRRSAIVVPLMRTAMGSRPIGPSWRILISAPSTNPSSSKRLSISSAAKPCTSSPT